MANIKVEDILSQTSLKEANHLLLYRCFNECLQVCHTSVAEARNYAENERACVLVEALMTVAIQAYAELNRWQEVLPYVTQVYNGLEDCPVMVTLLCLSLHAKVKDYATCTVIANIWLRNPANFSKPGYNSVTEMYVTQVLLVTERWDDVRPFLDTCRGLDTHTRDTYVRQVSRLRHQRDQDTADDIEVLSADDIGEPQRASVMVKCHMSTPLAFLQRIVEWLMTWCKTYVPVTMYVVRNICAITFILYFLVNRWQPDMLSSTVLTRLLGMLRMLWRGMFAPIYAVDR